MKFKQFLEMDLGAASKKMKPAKGNKELENLSKELKKLSYSDDIRHTVINIDGANIIVQFNAEANDKKYLKDIEKSISKTMKAYKYYTSSISRSLDKTGFTYYFKYKEIK